MKKATPSLPIILLALATAACSGGGSASDKPSTPTQPPQPPPQAQPKSRIVVSERPTTTDHDSVFTVLPGVLTATVYDATSSPVPGTAVVLKAVSPDGGLEMASVRLAGSPTAEWVALASPYARQFSTDATGRLQLSLRLGIVATTIRVDLRTAVAGLAAPETLSFVAIAGRTVRIVPTPRDSAAYVDRTYQVRTQTFDAYGNPTADAVHFTGDAVAGVTDAGLVTARRIGRAMLRLEAATVRDSVWTSVVPHGVLAATHPYPPRLVQFELDGSALATLASHAVAFPAWSHSGDRLAFSDFGQQTYYQGRILIREMSSGTERPLVAGYDDAGEYQLTPVFSSDDASILFAGRISLTRIVRVNIATGIADTIAKPPPWPPEYGSTGDPNPDGAYTAYADPSASTNGRYVAYWGGAPCCVTPVVYVRDLLAGTRVKIPGRAIPRWLGATDSLVAHVPNGFDVVRPDGTRVRGISYPAVISSGGITYNASPDGKWLAVSGSISDGPRVIEIVDLSSGMRLPLAFTKDMGSPAWRP